jgi:hypothetical protein
MLPPLPTVRAYTPPVASKEGIVVVPLHRTSASTVGVAVLALALAACGADAPSFASDSVSVPPTTAPSRDTSVGGTNLAAIGCATQDPTGVGDLTGAWSGSAGGVYYIRQVGDCVWWFGTEIDLIEPGVTGQGGFANVAAGRVNGPLIQVEWADIPLGNVIGGGGLTLVYDDESDQIWVTQQRGDWQPFGDSVLTRIEPRAPPDATATPSPTP